MDKKHGYGIFTWADKRCYKVGNFNNLGKLEGWETRWIGIVYKPGRSLKEGDLGKREKNKMD